MYFIKYIVVFGLYSEIIDCRIFPNMPVLLGGTQKNKAILKFKDLKVKKIKITMLIKLGAY